jgi:hypothetical protein
MLWSEIKKWAKGQGYDTIKDKGDEEKNESIKYYWSKIDNPDCSGVAASVSKLARAIFNDLTSDKWLCHQEEFRKNQTEVIIDEPGKF